MTRTNTNTSTGNFDARDAEIIRAGQTVNANGALKFGFELEWNQHQITRRDARDAVRAAFIENGIALEGRVTAEHNGSHGYQRGSTPAVVLADGRAFRFVEDGSVNGGELVSPVLAVEDLPMAMIAVRALKRLGCSHGGRGGLHVHVSAAPLLADTGALKRLIKLFSRYESFRACMTGRSAASTWAQPLAASTVAWAKGDAPRSALRVGSRYQALNLTRLDMGDEATVEFRMWDGVFHAGKVRAAIMLSLAMVNRALSAKRIKGLDKPFAPEWHAGALMTLITTIGLKGTYRYAYASPRTGRTVTGCAMGTVRDHIMARAKGMSGHQTPTACLTWILRNGRKLTTRQGASAAWPSTFNTVQATRDAVSRLIEDHNRAETRDEIYSARIVLKGDTPALLRDAGILPESLPRGLVFETVQAARDHADAARPVDPAPAMAA
jgi:hypothetical protein